jgi:hypothetical protein
MTDTEESLSEQIQLITKELYKINVEYDILQYVMQEEKERLNKTVSELNARKRMLNKKLTFEQMTNKFENYEHLELKNLVDGFRYELISKKDCNDKMDYYDSEYGNDRSVWLIKAYNKNSDWLLYGYESRRDFKSLCIRSNLIQKTYYRTPTKLNIYQLRDRSGWYSDNEKRDFELLHEYFKQIVPAEYYRYYKNNIWC